MSLEEFIDDNIIGIISCYKDPLKGLETYEDFERKYYKKHCDEYMPIDKYYYRLIEVFYRYSRRYKDGI